MQVGEEEHPPPHGLITVVPFVDLTAETGPTEYYMGTHVNVKDDLWIEQENDPPTPQLALEAIVGDVIIFDMRIRHRGQKNQSPSNRAIGYLGYVKDWYSDKVNFKDKQTAGFDNLPQKKLFSRLDTKQYTMNLEKLIEDTVDVDLKSMQSKGAYKKVEMHA